LNSHLYDNETIVLNALRHGNAVLIKLKSNDEALPCGIANFRDRGDLKLIELKAETLYGKPIRDTVILLDEIESIQRLTAIYEDPMYVKLRNIKKTLLNSV
jgi:hypothetical protein